MTGEEMIKAAIVARTANGLGLRMWGLEDRTEAAPFTCYASSEAQRDKWEAAYKAKGWTVERIPAVTQ